MRAEDVIGQEVIPETVATETVYVTVLIKEKKMVQQETAAEVKNEEVHAILLIVEEILKGILVQGLDLPATPIRGLATPGLAHQPPPAMTEEIAATETRTDLLDTTTTMIATEADQEETTVIIIGTKIVIVLVT